MAAGLGFKDFTTGEVLTAADVDGYLMQGVWVFADAAARTAAVASPQEGNFSFLKDTNSTEYYTGSAWVAVGGASALQVFTVNETQANTTQGGTFTSGAWRTRTLNTSVQNTITGASLSSNQFILPAGTYHLTAFAPCWKVGSNNARIYNITDASVVAIGNNQLSGTADTSGTTATVAVTFTIAGTKTFELQHYSSATLATNGFGAANGNGYDEIYSSVTIVKVG